MDDTKTSPWQPPPTTRHQCEFTSVTRSQGRQNQCGGQGSQSTIHQHRGNIQGDLSQVSQPTDQFSSTSLGGKESSFSSKLGK